MMGMAVGVVEVDEGVEVARCLVVAVDAVMAEVVAEVEVVEMRTEVMARVEAGCFRSNMTVRQLALRKDTGAFQ